MFGFGGYKKHHARRNELFFFILHPFASLDSSHLPGPQGTDSKNDREREPDRTLPRDAGFSVGAAGGGTPGQPAWHLGQVAPMAKREEGRSNANSGQGGFGHPISCLI